jgi:heme a synthase
MRLYRRLLIAATLLAGLVIALGAYVRLADAGLGCPDWPGCYGHWLGVPSAGHEQLAASAAFPQRPLDSGKAWKEMIHRYCAGTLGLLVLAIWLLAWREKIRPHTSPRLASLLLGIIGLQAALGMWTVTLLLKPVIVTLHLIGGMSTLALLLALILVTGNRTPSSPQRASRRWLAAVALLAVIAQIALGGWVSSNYAALACPDFPLCQGQWQPAADFSQAFKLHRELGQTDDGQLLGNAALTAVHWSHRLGAIVVLLAVGALSAALLRSGERTWRNWGSLLLALLLLQIGLGIGNVLLALPLPLALAHTLGAAALLIAVLSINILRAPRRAGQLRRAPGETGMRRREPRQKPA